MKTKALSALFAAAAGVLIFWTTPALGGGKNSAGPGVSAKELAGLLILDNGRIKPLDTYARNMLTQFSGRQTYRGRPAIQWFSRVIFTPLAAADDRVFLINNPEVADAAGIAPEKRRRYSFNELKKGYHQLAETAMAAGQKEPKERTVFENEIMRTSQNMQDYIQLSSVLMFLIPSRDFSVSVAEARSYLSLAPDTAQLSYYDLAPRSRLIAEAAAASEKKDVNTWTIFDMSMVALSRALSRWSASRGDQPLHIIPDSVDGREQWLCPWLYMLQAGPRAPETPELASLAAMRAAYVAADEKAFAKAAASLDAAVRRKAPAAPYTGMELFYNSVNPFAKSKLLYGIAAIAALLLMTVLPRRWLYAVCLGLVCAGFAPHTFGLISRVVIMHRPPLATIYETFLFVAWACVVLGAVLELFQKKSLGLLIASVSGFFFLHLAGRYAGGEDSMGMIAAVLNSNFWLTTHIMTVTLGYAGCCCAGIIGHVYLIRKIFLNNPEEKLSSVAGSLYGIFAFGLVFTVIGTMLGGMWADQSWGRFWGWDPKENGALLIILWGAVAFHAKASGLVGNRGFAAGAIVSLILVMFAWIGVNLLGIGMHSYGFTTTGATLLYSFIIFEAIFLVAVGAGAMVSIKKKAAE